MTIADPRFARLITLIRAALRPPAGAGHPAGACVVMGFFIIFNSIWG